jgi:hypothetical protein
MTKQVTATPTIKKPIEKKKTGRRKYEFNQGKGKQVPFPAPAMIVSGG